MKVPWCVSSLSVGFTAGCWMLLIQTKIPSPTLLIKCEVQPPWEHGPGHNRVVSAAERRLKAGEEVGPIGVESRGEDPGIEHTSLESFENGLRRTLVYSTPYELECPVVPVPLFLSPQRTRRELFPHHLQGQYPESRRGRSDTTSCHLHVQSRLPPTAHAISNHSPESLLSRHFSR